MERMVMFRCGGSLHQGLGRTGAEEGCAGGERQQNVEWKGDRPHVAISIPEAI